MAIEFNDRRPGKGADACPMCGATGSPTSKYTIRGHNRPVCKDCEYEIMDTYRDAGFPGVSGKKPKGYDERRKGQGH